MMPLDFSALREPTPKKDFTAYWNWIRGARFKILSKKTAGFLLYYAAALLYAFMKVGSDFPPFVTIIITSLLSIGGWVAIYASIHFRGLYLKRVEKFAASNGLTFLKDIDDPLYEGTLFNVGDSRKILETYLFPDGTEIGNYTFTVGHGRHTSTFTWFYMSIKLPKRLPHMFLDALSNGFLKNSYFAQNVSGQNLSLEGDFDKYFNLYVPQGYERDALYIFTPDVMQALIESSRMYDMEIIDDRVVLFSPTSQPLDVEQTITQALSILKAVNGQISHQAQRYSDERIISGLPDMISGSGRRLKQKKSSQKIIFPIILIILKITVVGCAVVLGYVMQQRSVSESDQRSNTSVPVESGPVVDVTHISATGSGLQFTYPNSWTLEPATQLQEYAPGRQLAGSFLYKSSRSAKGMQTNGKISGLCILLTEHKGYFPWQGRVPEGFVAIENFKVGESVVSLSAPQANTESANLRLLSQDPVSEQGAYYVKLRNDIYLFARAQKGCIANPEPGQSNDITSTDIEEAKSILRSVSVKE